MTIECKYNIEQIVKIPQLEGLKGVIVAVWKDGTGIQYQVRYFNQGKSEKEYFYENEIEPVKAYE